MPEIKITQFNSQWEKIQKEPAVKAAAVKQVAAGISIRELLDSFQELADKAVKQRRLKKQDYDELSGQLGSLRKLVARIGEKALLEAGQA